jgi:hypothetical protein
MYADLQLNPAARAFNIYGEPIVSASQPSLRGRKTLYADGFSEYERHTVWLSERPMDYRNAVDSDRLTLDSSKYERLAKQHFGDVSHYWSKRRPAQIEGFIADYFMLPPGCVKLVKVTKERNRSNGQHIWTLYYTYEIPAGFSLLH